MALARGLANGVAEVGDVLPGVVSKGLEGGGGSLLEGGVLVESLAFASNSEVSPSILPTRERRGSILSSVTDGSRDSAAAPVFVCVYNGGLFVSSV